jgi:hypothetical protein
MQVIDEVVENQNPLIFQNALNQKSFPPPYNPAPCNLVQTYLIQPRSQTPANTTFNLIHNKVLSTGYR